MSPQSASTTRARTHPPAGRASRPRPPRPGLARNRADSGAPSRGGPRSSRHPCRPPGGGSDPAWRPPAMTWSGPVVPPVGRRSSAGSRADGRSAAGPGKGPWVKVPLEAHEAPGPEGRGAAAVAQQPPEMALLGDRGKPCISSTGKVCGSCKLIPRRLPGCRWPAGVWCGSRSAAGRCLNIRALAASLCWSAAASNASSRDSSTSGSRTTSASTAWRFCAISEIVSRSKRSVLYSKKPSSLSGEPENWSLRSCRTSPACTAARLRTSPGSSGAGGEELWTTNQTRNGASFARELRRRDSTSFSKGEVAMGVRLGDRLPHPLEQLPERGIAGQIGHQHQGIDEEADQPLTLHAVTVSDGNPHPGSGPGGRSGAEGR